MKKINSIVSTIAIVFAGQLLAQSPGSLDPTFDTDGKVITQVGTGIDYGYAVAIQSDGKILLAGSAAGAVSNDFALVRYNTDGSLDNSFDGDGKVTTELGGSEFAHAIAIQSDGKIVLAGNVSPFGIEDFALVRYNSDGSLDNTFDSDGKLTIDFGGLSESIRSVAIQSDGKIIVSGYSHVASNDDFAVARFNSNGSLDNTFSGDGKATADFGSNELALSMVLQSDGKIIVAGFSGSTPNGNFAVARFSANGTLDNTFDSDGMQTVSFVADDRGTAVALQPDGKIVVGGVSDYGVNTDYALARFNSNGSLDNTFDSDGKITFDIGSSQDNANAVIVQPDGKIILAGSTLVASSAVFAVTRHNPDGSLDNTFDGDGKLTTPFGGTYSVANSVALQSDGKILVAGQVAGASNDDFGIARYFSGLIGIPVYSIDNNSVFVYPNPVISNSKLEYTLTFSDNVTISLLDVQGKIIKTFVDSEYQEPGNYSSALVFPEKMAAGSYYVVISTPSNKVSVKIIK